MLVNIIQLHSVRNVHCSSLYIYLSLCCGHLILVQEVESHIEEMEMVSSTSPLEKTTIKPAAPSNHRLVVPIASTQGTNSTLQAPLDSPGKAEKNGHAKETPRIAKVFEIQSMPNGKLRTSLLKAMNRRKLSQQKEKKATQMLAIVLGESTRWLPLLFLQETSSYPGLVSQSERRRISRLPQKSFHWIHWKICRQEAAGRKAQGAVQRGWTAKGQLGAGAREPMGV